MKEEKERTEWMLSKLGKQIKIVDSSEQQTPSIHVIDKRVMTTSMDVANYFNKNHKDVLRIIANLECAKEFTERNFTLSEYTDSTGRKLPLYLITRDGFTILVMGFTGAMAMKFKIAYLEAFNKMDEAIRKTGSYVSGGSVVTLAMKLNLFLNEVAVAGYCNQTTLKEYCWLRTLGLPQGMAGAACNIRSISQLQAIDRRLKRIGVTFSNLQFATRKKIMDANFEKLFSRVDLAAIDRVVPKAEVAHE